MQTSAASRPYPGGYEDKASDELANSPELTHDPGIVRVYAKMADHVKSLTRIIHG